MNIVMIAGEVSGDLLGGKLAQELFRSHQVTSISGIGGDLMRKANVSTLYDVSETSVVGIIEVLKHYPRLHRILRDIKQHLRDTKPELLILIDYPEFNLKLASFAKSLNIKVLFYVSPQVWAWRTGRVKKMQKCIDLMAVLFPFEVEFYRQANIPVCHVRHPLLADIDNHFSANSAGNSSITVGLAPGSRQSEIKKLFPIMLEAANLLKQHYRDIKFVTPLAPGIDIKTLEHFNHYNLEIKYTKKSFYQTIDCCNVVAIASGTATLQTALMGKAMVVIYRISPVTYRLFGHLVKTDHICLANIILGRRAYTELIQKDANATRLYNELKSLIDNPQIASKMQTNRNEIYNKLKPGIDSKALAAKALALTQH